MKIETDKFCSNRYRENVILMFKSRFLQFENVDLEIDNVLQALNSMFDKHFLNQFYLDDYEDLYNTNPDHFWIRLERLIWFSLMYDIQFKEGVIL